MIVRFNRNFSPFNAGESAGFNEAEGARLVTDGIAQAVVSAEDVQVKEDLPASEPEAAPSGEATPKATGRRK